MICTKVLPKVIDERNFKPTGLHRPTADVVNVSSAKPGNKNKASKSNLVTNYCKLRLQHGNTPIFAKACYLSSAPLFYSIFVTRNRLSSVPIVSSRADHLVTNNAKPSNPEVWTPSYTESSGKLSCNMVSVRTSSRINPTTLQQNMGELPTPANPLVSGRHLLDEVVQLDLSIFESERIQLKSKGQSLPWSTFVGKKQKMKLA